jgi:hypothetical protein
MSKVKTQVPQDSQSKIWFVQDLKILGNGVLAALVRGISRDWRATYGCAK